VVVHRGTEPLYATGRIYDFLGYVRMGGMEAGGFRKSSRRLHSKPAWQRIVILAGGPAANSWSAMLLIGVRPTRSTPTPARSFGRGRAHLCGGGMQAGDSIRAVTASRSRARVT